MIVKPYTEVSEEQVTMEGALNTTIRWLVSDRDGAPNFYMRLFEVSPGGYTPYHAHKGEHEIFILEGEGQLNTEDGTRPLTAGSFAFVPEGEKHQFMNTGERPMKFICVVPKSY